MKIKLGVGFIMMVISMTSWGFSTIVSDKYYFGDGDSKSVARDILLQKLKLKASNKAGVYVQSDKKYSSKGALSKKINIISASIVKMDILSEKVGVDKSGRIYLFIKAKADVDTNLLKKRIKILQQNTSKQKAIKRLTDENKRLHRKLLALEKEFKNKKLTPYQAATLAKEQAEISQELQRNSNNVSLVFKRGTLLNLASSQEMSEKKYEKEIKKRLANAIYQVNKAFKPRVASIREENGYYSIDIEINNPSETEKINEALYFSKRQKCSDAGMYLNGDRDRKFVILKLFDNYYKNLFLEVNVGKVKDRIFYYGFSKDFFSCRGSKSVLPSNADLKKIIKGGYNTYSFGMTYKSYGGKNGLKLDGKFHFYLKLSEAQARNADNIGVKIVSGSGVKIN